MVTRPTLFGVLTRPRPSAGLTRTCLYCGLLAGPLFTLVYLAAGVAREAYSPWRHPISSLALGKQGWVQVLNFLATGGLLVAFGVGAQRTRSGSPWLGRIVTAIGVGLIGAGMFACDPLGGYPPGTAPRPERPSVRGALHRLFSAFVFLGMPAAFVVVARGSGRVWRAYSLATLLAFVAAFAASSAGFAQAPRFADVGGLWQRLTLSLGFGWLSLRAADLLHRLPKG